MRLKPLRPGRSNRAGNTAASMGSGTSAKAGDKVALTWRIKDAFVVD